MQTIDTPEHQPRGLLAAVFILLPLAAAASIGAGLLLWAAERYANIYFIVAFPIIAGALVGLVLSLFVRVFRVRTGLLLGVICVIAGIVIMGTYHFATYYLTFREEIRTLLEEEIGETVAEEDLNQFIDDLLADEGKEKGFVGFMQLNAEEGFTVTRGVSTGSSSGIELKDTLAWLYWGAEIVLASISASGIVRKAAVSLTPTAAAVAAA